MRTKNIFKTVALAMLMPAMLLTSACSNQDDIANTSNITSKGYALPVTVSATRQGDATTRATYNESTKKLSFSSGDKLFVSGQDNGGAESFAGVLDLFLLQETSAAPFTPRKNGSALPMRFSRLLILSVPPCCLMAMMLMAVIAFYMLTTTILQI